jgi:hypothetical protein
VLEAGVNHSLWTPWGTKLAVLLTVALVFSLAWLWLATFYLEQPSSEILSWVVADLPAHITNPERYSAVGNHYFSDFIIPIDWVDQARQQASSPYGPGVVYLPFAIVFFWALALLPAAVSLVLYMAATLSALVAAFWLLLRPLAPSTRLILTLVALLVTTPFVAIFDRGNIQGLIVAAIMWGVLAWRAGYWKLGALAIGFACAIKGYPAVLLLVPILAGKPKAAALGLASAFLANLAAVVALPGGLAANVKGYVEATTDFASTGMIDAQVSLAAAIMQWSSIFNFDITSSVSVIALLSAITWVFGVIWLLWNRHVPEWIGLVLLLASLQVAVPTSYSYTMSWAFLGVVWFGWGSILKFKKATGDDEPGFLRWLIAAALVATLTPFAFRTVINGTVIDIQGLASPTFLALSFVAALGWSLHRTFHSARVECQPVSSGVGA